MAKTDENLISLAAGEQEEEDGLMCFREEDRPGGMLMGAHLPYFYLSCQMLSFTRLPKSSFMKIQSFRALRLQQISAYLGSLNLNYEE